MSFSRLFQRTRCDSLRYVGAFRTPPVLRPANGTRWQSSSSNEQQTQQQQVRREDPTPSAARQSLHQYGILSKPWLKVFLGAFFTYQVLFWCWEKMRTDEVMERMQKEVEELERELAKAQANRGNVKQ